MQIILTVTSLLLNHRHSIARFYIIIPFSLHFPPTSFRFFRSRSAVYHGIIFFLFMEYARYLKRKQIPSRILTQRKLKFSSFATKCEDFFVAAVCSLLSSFFFKDDFLFKYLLFSYFYNLKAQYDDSFLLKFLKNFYFFF